MNVIRNLTKTENQEKAGTDSITPALIKLIPFKITMDSFSLPAESVYEGRKDAEIQK